MRHSLFVLLAFFCSSLPAQNVEVSGTVTDSLDNPLEMATVIALDKNQTVTSYSITDADGFFSMLLPENGKFILKVNFLGLKPEEQEIILRKGEEGPHIFDFVLYVDEDTLDDVEVNYEMPVVKRGDTLVYNADSFTNGTERKLGDILKKLPGISVNDNGEIEVEGKKVSKVMIEGKDFFDGDSKLATQNIPADAVDKVEILRNHNDVDQMRNLLTTEENIAVNLQLKEGKKNFWFGEIEGGVGKGDDIRHSAGSSVFYHSPRSSINFIADLNNIGDVPFTFRDYFNFIGGLPSVGGSGSSVDLGEDDLGFLTMQDEKAQDSKNIFGAANFSYEISPRWDLSGFGLLSSTYTHFKTRNSRRYISSHIIEENFGESHEDNDLAMAKLKSVYKHSPNFQLDYTLLLKSSDQLQSSEGISKLSEGEIANAVGEEKAIGQFVVRQNANVYYTLDEENILAGNFNHQYQNLDHLYEANVQLQPFEDILPLHEDQDYFDIGQEKELEANSIDFKFDYYHVLNKTSNINFNFGTFQTWQLFNSAIFQNLDPRGRTILQHPELINDISYHFSDLFLGMKYNLKTGIFTISPGINVHRYATRNQQSGKIVQEKQIILTPSFRAVAELGKTESLRLNYGVAADYSNVEDFAEGYLFSDYNRLFRGNRYLQNAINHNLNLSYFNFNMFNFTNIYSSMNYSRRVHAISNATKIENISLISSPINSDLPDQIFGATASIEKTFRRFKTKLSTNIFVNDYNLVVNYEAVKSQNFSQNYKGSILTNFKKSPHIEIGYSRGIRKFENAELESIYLTDSPFATINYVFLRDFNFRAQWEYNDFSNKENTLEESYSFVEADLFYRKKNSRWEFSIKGKNLLNVTSLNRSSFDLAYNSTNKFFVQPRTVLAIVKYNF